MKKSVAILLLAGLAAGCGGAEPAAPQNEAARVTSQLLRQRDLIAQQGDASAVAVEREMEKQGEALFENRGNPFNESEDAAAKEAEAVEAAPLEAVEESR